MNNEASTLSVGIVTWDRSYRKLLSKICVGSIGKNGKNMTSFIAPITIALFPHKTIAEKEGNITIASQDGVEIRVAFLEG